MPAAGRIEIPGADDTVHEISGDLCLDHLTVAVDNQLRQSPTFTVRRLGL